MKTEIEHRMMKVLMEPVCEALRPFPYRCTTIEMQPLIDFVNCAYILTVVRENSYEVYNIEPTFEELIGDPVQSSRSIGERLAKLIRDRRVEPEPNIILGEN